MFDPTKLSECDVAEFIPHREPMILITKLLEHSHDSLLTQTDISASSPYFDSLLNGVPNYVGIEYMAQSIAALAGVEAHLRDDIIRVGFLLGSRKLKMHISQFDAGQSYLTRVIRLYQEESGLAVFDCQILHNQVVVAEANVNVFQPQDTQAYIADSTD
ncbi:MULTISPECIES: thioester dehydrase [unclassified Shewanella]|uniref:ApeP family dehydratase n=1 Tax=unclassified Shewanella TaxID=196818 RepID=UPI001BC7BDFB|nr:MULTISPECIES: thioester dehydrase [unclassified Shewanella]GIU11335.1 thioester dehydrase [Shewanella sp. MBTL60-112-B1]GIU31042.1 thioester dehydrase [Shewanella sp. MBTL60-112-B2]